MNKAIILQSSAIEKIQLSIGFLGTTVAMGGKALLFLMDEALVTFLKNTWQNNTTSFQDSNLTERYTDSYETGLLSRPYDMLIQAKSMGNLSVYGCSTTCKINHLLDTHKKLDGILGLTSFLNLAKDFEIQII